MTETGETPRRAAKKHPCPDCRSCQFCSDRRCDLCGGWLVGGACPERRRDEADGGCGKENNESSG